MTTVVAGQPWNLVSNWTEYPGGPAANVTGLTIQITRVAGSLVVVAATSSGITNPEVGTYVYPEDSDPDLVAGEYVARWEDDGDNVATETFTVAASTTATWATVGDVLSVTGATVTQAQLNAANEVISAYVNRMADLDLDVISERDAHWLNRAVCWQAAWQPGQPGFELRNNASNVSQDGLAVTRDAEHYVTLAPMAARAMRNLSWIGRRTTRQLSTLSTVDRPLIDFLNESSDHRHGWAPLEIS